MSSIFTKIINREIPSTIVYEDIDLIVIKDINPKAKTHLLIIPKKEIISVEYLTQEDEKLISSMFFVAQKVARNLGINEGYKLQINVGEKGGQEVPHLHLHLLSNI